ncbi:hypothetical protein AbraIFM66951_010066 [Aspergillus brasiliensis]|uniref:Mitochondrial K+-H+ exchange-related-domain-containing protein n=2 Tax=Aspergillus brasiliensis TaxID=319629 RepID=A0A1L9UPJ2_ASPBC|nr:hypothetical protein ASPBRDRAFT_41308 [Aspergillus brasiliensis CBS 101740]GKZ23644.1 hypothetical protein AbraCBS73388_010219 [Aspergillus brasiliensis]GKZ46899.1 hypothetical protein AbraIFM66951_010066 [Aspergillus brasiliensis]
MRLFVIPISTRQALIYARPLRRGPSQKTSIHDRVIQKAAETWAKWEEADKGWKKYLVSWGNRVQQRIPYQEWGLKSIPSLAAVQRLDESYGTKKVDVLFPGNAIRPEKLQKMLQAIATERQDLHRRRMWLSLLGAPLTAPIGLIPLVPNVPFFYLVYRAWSHGRAFNGSKHLEFLLEKDLLNPISYPGLEALYAKRVSYALENTGVDKPMSEMVEDVEKSDDRLLLRMTDAKKLASILEAPDLALEAERAIIQVEEKLKAEAKKDGEDGHSEKKDT